MWQLSPPSLNVKVGKAYKTKTRKIHSVKRRRAWSGGFKAGNNDVSAFIPLPQQPSQTAQKEQNLLLGRGQNLGTWFSGVWTQSGLVPCWSHATMVRHFGEADAPEVGCGPCPVFALYTGFRLKTKGNHIKLSVIFACTALGMILCVDLVTVLQAASADQLNSVTLSRRFRRLGSTLGQRKYLPSCEVRVSPWPANLVVTLGSGCDVVGEDWNSQILANLPATSTPRRIGLNAKTLGLNVGASDGPPDGTRVAHLWMRGLLIQQNSISDGETTPHA